MVRGTVTEIPSTGTILQVKQILPRIVCTTNYHITHILHMEKMEAGLKGLCIWEIVTRPK